MDTLLSFQEDIDDLLKQQEGQGSSAKTVSTAHERAKETETADAKTDRALLVVLLKPIQRLSSASSSVH